MIRYEQREQRDCDKNETRVLHERHERDRRATQTTRVRHEWIFFYFDNDTSVNIFSHHYIEKLQGEEQFHY